ncbi:MAG: Sir2 histone deacetylase Hst2 [Candelina submexicana]|nr:MAG: Sir2 histone deacetylase Hst2 [Candelina submexicana]
MGQESSTLVDESTPPQTLKSRTVESVARHIKDGRAKKIVVMTGAGISTSAGIPDFRSPDTGLYANLERLNLPYAEAVFDISYFRQNPYPFYMLAHELYPGRFRPTISHSFVRLLYDKGLLMKLFTQNIDCLEREAGVPGNKIVEAHGSFAKQSCIDCKTPFPDDLMRKLIAEKEVPECQVPECGGLVKPNIVFFGEQLPEEFHKNRSLPAAADLCIVMGTSLTVQPFASLPGFCSEGVPRVLMNKERVGSLGSRPDDVLILGDCDTGVRKLAQALGWLEELDVLWAKTNPDSASREEQNKPPNTKDEALEAEVEKLTGEVQTTLKLSNDHANRLREHLENKHDLKQGPNKEAGAGKEIQKPAIAAEGSTEQTDKGEAHGSDGRLDKKWASSDEDPLKVFKEDGKALL